MERDPVRLIHIKYCFERIVVFRAGFYRLQLEVIVFIEQAGQECRFTSLNAVDNPAMCPEFPPLVTIDLIAHPIRRRSKAVQVRNHPFQLTTAGPRRL